MIFLMILAATFAFVENVVVRQDPFDYCGNVLCTEDRPVCGVVKGLLDCQDLESDNSSVINIIDSIDTHPIRLW